MSYILDCYDAIDLVAEREDAPSQLLGATARKVADLWNDPPRTAIQREWMRAVFPELTDALDELLGGGPVG